MFINTHAHPYEPAFFSCSEKNNNMADETVNGNTTERGVEDILRDLPRSAESLDQVATWLRTQNQNAQLPPAEDGSVLEDSLTESTGDDNYMASEEDTEGTDVIPSMIKSRARVDSLS